MAYIKGLELIAITDHNSLKQQLQELHADEYFQVKARLDSMTQEIVDNNTLISKQHEELSSLTERSQKVSKQLKNCIRVLNMYLIIFSYLIFSTATVA